MSTWPRVLTAAIFVFAGLGCTASAKVTRTTPVANLRSYKVVQVRAKGTYGRLLASNTVAYLSRMCHFTNVELAEYSRTKPDLVIDLKVHRYWRGTTGIIRNPNKAYVDVLMVLSDGIDQELLGSAWIRGESATLNVQGTSPEGQAIAAVAKTVAKVLSKSGCRGTRIARAPDPPPTTIAKSTTNGGGNTDGGGTTVGNGTTVGDGNTDGGGTTTDGSGGSTDGSGGATDGSGNNTGGDQTGTAAAKSRAETLNKEGKQLFISADIRGAIRKFEQASRVYPDPRYDFNICLGYESEKRYSDALSMCRRVLRKNPSAKLRSKAQKRLGIIAELRKNQK